ncbi:MarR family winged helix-turn-helix transcriptional regulator [Nocardia gipuzkoensis]|jgi:DNA-binding MarR family transcriptional regulator|uniref:MarR family winged helix-turn-helix transcriptional regulator n=1 Tax=Nocardia TaxID=1817 RepID=UPI0015EF27E9|nr:MULTISPECIES: MarR family winged helix-turn-helix transcriptional regulator [Nocardia]MBF6222643.1 winged helix-turn-helix transcriptional regulator [Nocardia abscessus]MBF6472067.1 winged helix-turn-helix transcriptional regulator [Nocardia abscessus]MDE1671165.1 MarR family winged helix-turn-helix transcriptional regulator [Nocardia gipuzkoensis]
MVRWLSDDEQATWQAYVRLRQRLDGAISAGLAEDGLSLADYELMVALSAAPNGCLRAKELAAEVCWEKSRLSKHLARMDARGLVERRPAEEDARGIIVQLTPDGRVALERAAPNHVDLVRRVFVEPMTAGEARVLRALADKVVAEVEQVTELGA